ncbi:conserved hypothetical protein [Plasmopara halstedii]|uniref:FYVE-type domain-containing protein n=1 Tax=Plasmopara halstedii TaxID=4781 RepID=A0A0P1B6N5_PLAHL|nr:conserved hypothetical protein [Plasmopara halstedii]CEG49768.1 conserved hypothetical protein [Plasmopara halstedii]|eukprot:XP_024586137.1 conserved hypothetical protein [Plasmopara halstedii]
MPRRSSTALSRTASVSSTASSHQGGKLQFPLPDDYFPPVSLTLAQVQQFHTQVEELAIDAMESCRDHENRVAGFSIADDKQWQDVTRDSDLSIVRRKQGSLTITRTFGTVMSNFRRFVDFFSSETSEQLFAWNQFFFGCAVDAVALCSLNINKSAKHATLGIKWTCIQPSMLTRKRDECFLEYITYKKDDQGRDVAIIVRTPVDIPECPPFPHELKTKREKVTSVMVVRKADLCPDKTQIFMLSKCEHKGLTATTKFCKKLLRAFKDVSLSADAKKIATSPGLAEQSYAGGDPYSIGDGIRPWVPPATIQQGCTDCSRTFRAGRRRRYCQLCGDMFCSKCLVRRAGIRQEKNGTNNQIPMTSQRTFRVAQSLFCKVCVGRTREEDPEPILEHAETTRSSVVSSKSSQATRRSSLTKSQIPKSSTPTSSVSRSSLSYQKDAPRRSATWIEEHRNSWWSENESDTCSWKSGSSRFSTISRNCSGAPTVRSSFSSEYSYSRNSFLAVQSLETPCEIDADRINDCIDERSSIYEVIDTKDMTPESEHQKQLRSQQSSASVCTDSTDDGEHHDGIRNRYTSTPIAPTFLPPHSNIARRTHSTDQNDNAGSSKSLEQCIAEQNELLQQVLSASRGFSPDVRARVKASSAGQSTDDDDDDEGHDDGVYEL